MTIVSRRELIAGVGVGGAGLVIGAAAMGDASFAAPRRRAAFRVYDGLQSYIGKPSLARWGVRPLYWGDPDIGMPSGPSASAPPFPDPAIVARFVESVPDDSAPVVLDIEQFPVTGAGARVAAARLATIMATFRRAIPHRSLGYYAVLPQADYWRAIAPLGSREHRAWRRENDFLAPVARMVDALYPSLYTFYPDRDGWIAYARAQVNEARRLANKPVYAFVWPEYHSSSKVQGFLDPSYWRLQLEMLRTHADGIVVFGGWDERAVARRHWDDNAPWWRELRAFMASIS